jgi:alkylation response protein AidB-like acyl-CoA dehydrogenase
MAEPFSPRQELGFLLFDWLGLGPDETDRQTFSAILDLAEDLATDSFLTHAKLADRQEPRLGETGVRILPEAVQALHRYAELGLFGVSFPTELGGLGLPPTLALALYGVFAAANISTAAYPMLTAANARLISAFGTPAQIDRFARPEIEGRWFGTMCLSEPQAGSDLAIVRTRAAPDGEDELGARYRLAGNKMWISGGDQDASQNIVHLVLAKAARPGEPLPEGTRGLSLFIVPKLLADGTRNDVTVAGLNHKLGYRGTANCLLNLGEGPGAIGWLVGREGEGLAQMFMMMNEARLYVGMGAAVLAYRGYRHSARYASERMQGRRAGGGAPAAIIEHADVRRMLLRQKAYAEGALALCLYCAQLIDRDDAESAALLALLTPVAKSWSSEFGLKANDLAIQVHGGYGYTRDFDVEQLWRDNRLNPIHEGTTGIQAIDLLGRKLLRSNGEGLAALRRRMDSTAAQAPADLEAHAAALRSFWRRVDEVLGALGGSDPSTVFDDATLFLDAFGHGVIAWLWLDQLRAADAAGEPIRTAKRAACRYFFHQELPQAERWLDIVGAQDGVVRSTPSEVFHDV